MVIREECKKGEGEREERKGVGSKHGRELFPFPIWTFFFDPDCKYSGKCPLKPHSFQERRSIHPVLIWASSHFTLTPALWARDQLLSHFTDDETCPGWMRGFQGSGHQTNGWSVSSCRLGLSHPKDHFLSRFPKFSPRLDHCLYSSLSREQVLIVSCKLNVSWRAPSALVDNL